MVVSQLTLEIDFHSEEIESPHSESQIFCDSKVFSLSTHHVGSHDLYVLTPMFRTFVALLKWLQQQQQQQQNPY